MNPRMILWQSRPFPENKKTIPDLTIEEIREKTLKGPLAEFEEIFNPKKSRLVEIAPMPRAVSPKP